MIATTGYIDEAYIKGSGLVIEGWVGNRDGLPLVGLHLMIDGVNWNKGGVQMKINQPSKDLATIKPELGLVKQLRFSYSIPMSSTEFKLIKMIRLTPYYINQLGQSLFKILRRPIPYPPEELVLAVGGGFDDVTFEFLDYFISLGGLKPDSKVLDVGCGVGRMAYSLSYVLNGQGLYRGFDVVDNLIRWPKNTITPLFPNFKFKKVNLYNKWYNPEGNLDSKTFKFPYKDKLFDLITLCSVFTHLLPEEMTHYLNEIHRVLDNQGVCLCTAFLLNDTSRESMRINQDTLKLIHPYKHCFIKNPDVPEETIGYQEERFIKTARKHGFHIDSIHYGSWSGRTNNLSYQDIVILKKDSSDQTNQNIKRWIGRLFP